MKKTTTKQISTATLLSETENNNTIATNLTRYWLKVDASVSTNGLTGAKTKSSTTYDANGNILTTSTNVNAIETTSVKYSEKGFNAFGSPYQISSSTVRVGKDPVVKQIVRTYNVKGDVTAESNYDSNNGTLTISTTLTNVYNTSNGVLTRTTLSSTGLLSKTTLLDYDTKFRYVIKTTNLIPTL